MPIQTFEQEWRSSNQETAYPFTDQTRPEQIPSDFLIDAQFAFAGHLELDAVVEQIEYDSVNDAYRITVTLAGSISCFGTEDIPRLLGATSRVGSKVIVTDGGSVMILQPGRAWEDPTWGGAGSWSVTPSGGNIIQPALVMRQPQTLRRIFIDHLPIPPENEWPLGVSQKLQAGFNLEFTNSPFDFTPSIVRTPLTEDIWSLRAVPGAGAGYPGAGENTIDYLASLGGVGPDSSGNINLVGNDCIRISVPEVDAAPIPGTIQVASDCQPCCPCPEYRSVSRAVGRRSAKIKDYCDQIASTLTEAGVAYEEGVAKVNGRRPPLALVRNVRAVGAHIMFTVVNASDVPIYAYVATDLLFYTGTSPLPLVGQGSASSEVANVSQVGFPTVDLAINAHRLTLPAMDFSSLENPTAPFPSGTFSPLDTAHSLIAVAGRSMEQAFCPIPPGQAVEVALYSAAVEADIGTLLTDPSSYDTPAEREAIVAKTIGAKGPMIRFRTVAVYGSSHAYPCAGETFTVSVQEFPPDDVTRTICETNLERRFQAVEVNVRKQIGGQS